MQPRALAYVEAVARLGTFTAAARELHVAQPAVSAQVAALERQLGTALFTRHATGARTTPAGDLVAARARRIQAELIGVEEDLAALQGLHGGVLRIGATPLLGPIDLPEMTRRYRHLYPDIRVIIRTALVPALHDDLERGDLDVVLGPMDGAPLRGFSAHPLHDESLVLILPPGRELTTISELDQEPFVCLPEGSGLRRLLDAISLEAGFEARVDVEVTDPHQIPQYVHAGLGAAVVAASIARSASASVQVVPLPTAPPHPPLGILSSLTPSAAAAAFIQLARGGAQG